MILILHFRNHPISKTGLDNQIPITKSNNSRFGLNDSKISRHANRSANSRENSRENSHENSRENERGKSVCGDYGVLINKSSRKSRPNASVNTTFVMNNSYVTNNNNYSFDIFTSNRHNINNKKLNLTMYKPKNAA